MYTENLKNSRSQTGYKYIHPLYNKPGRYVIRKTIDGKQKYFGFWDSIDKAIEEVKFLIAHDWKYNSDKRKYVPKLPENKYIYQNKNGTYLVVKSLNGRTYNFGSYHSLDEARKKRDYFQENDWDLKLREVKPRKSKQYPKYISKQGKSFVVIRTIDDEMIAYDRCRTLEEAISCRDWWMEHNWDLDCIDLM